jgi:hypothetical protein
VETRFLTPQKIPYAIAPGLVVTAAEAIPAPQPMGIEKLQAAIIF